MFPTLFCDAFNQDSQSDFTRRLVSQVVLPLLFFLGFENGPFNCLCCGFISAFCSCERVVVLLGHILVWHFVRLIQVDRVSPLMSITFVASNK